MHDKSKHAKCLIPQFRDTSGTKSNYELYATINRIQHFTEQFIIHKNNKMYLSDRTRRVDFCAACWKEGRDVYFIQLLKYELNQHIKNVSPTFLSRIQILQDLQVTLQPSGYFPAIVHHVIAVCQISTFEILKNLPRHLNLKNPIWKFLFF